MGWRNIRWGVDCGTRCRLTTIALATTVAMLGCTVNDVVGQTVGAGNGADAAAPTIDGAANAACEGALFCSNFEQGLNQYDTVQTGGTLAVASEGFTGGAALQPAIDQGSGAAYLRVNLETPGLTTLYLRGYLWVSSDAVLEDIAVFFLGPTSGLAGINVDLRAGDRFELFLPEHDVSILSEPGVLHRDVWQCLQLGVVVDDTSGEAVLSIDGQAVAEQSALDTDPGADLALFTLGIEWSSSQQGPVSVLLDDVVLSQSPVECL